MCCFAGRSSICGPTFVAVRLVLWVPPALLESVSLRALIVAANVNVKPLDAYVLLCQTIAKGWQVIEQQAPRRRRLRFESGV
jgi:hypothetical protein